MQHEHPHPLRGMRDCREGSALTRHGRPTSYVPSVVHDAREEGNGIGVSQVQGQLRAQAKATQAVDGSKIRVYRGTWYLSECHGADPI